MMAQIPSTDLRDYQVASSTGSRKLSLASNELFICALLFIGLTLVSCAPVVALLRE